jgi:glycerate kinase
MSGLRVLVAPNSFRDGLDAEAAAAALAGGVRRAMPAAEVVEMPLADGGDGSLGVLWRMLGGELHHCSVSDPLHRPRGARFALAADGTAIVEMAEASGLRLVEAERRDPFRSSTRGTGELIRAALDRGARRILVAAGGSGTIDGGAGALAALGAVFRDGAGRPLEPIPSALAGLAAVDLAGLDPRLAEVELTVLSDVLTPIENHVEVFGPQKGLAPGNAEALERFLHRWMELAAARGSDLAGRPWVGAGGCLAGGLVAFADARAESGADAICRLAGLSGALDGAALAITGEGRFDATSGHGKLTTVVAAAAAARGVPAVVIAGQVAGARELPPGVVACFSAAPGPLSLSQALERAPEELARTAEQVARLFLAARPEQRRVGP